MTALRWIPLAAAGYLIAASSLAVLLGTAIRRCEDTQDSVAGPRTGEGQRPATDHPKDTR